MKSRRHLRLIAFLSVMISALGVGLLSLPSGSVEGTVSRENAPRLSSSSAFADYGGTDLTDVDSNVSMRIIKSTRSDVCQSYSYIIENDGNDDYILGYYGDGSDYKPLTFIYNVTTGDGTTEERTSEMTQYSSNSLYDAVGSTLGDTEFKNSADLFIGSSDEVDVSSVKVINIYKAVRDSSGNYVPDYAAPYYLQNPTVTAAGRTNYELSQFLNVKFDRISFFRGYTALDCEYQNIALDMYKNMYSSYSKHIDSLTDGTEKIFYSFTGMTNSYYYVIFKDGTSYKKFITGTSYIELNQSGGKLRFLLPGLDPYNIKSFYLGGATFSMSIMTVSTSKVIVGSSYTIRFGAIDFVSQAAAPGVLNINSILIWTSVAFLLASLGFSLALFFYRSNKYKNDEFLRVDPKSFAKTSLISVAALGTAILDAIIISMRATDFNNSLTVYNPLDPFIIVFSVALLLFIGYFVKFFTAMIKDHIAKRRSDRLKLNDTQADDGTVTVSKSV